MNARTRRFYQSAADYAAFDKSDPFALNRALSHIDNGIAGVRPEDGSDATYAAEAYVETVKLPDGQTFSRGNDNEYQVVGYRNVKRP